MPALALLIGDEQIMRLAEENPHKATVVYEERRFHEKFEREVRKLKRRMKR